MSYFIPSKSITINSKDPPWITKSLKRMLSRQNRQYKNYKKHGFKREDKVYVDSFRKECEDAVHSAKENYFKNMSTKLADPSTNPKSYWKFVNKILNKCKAPRIPPLLVNNQYVNDSKEKAEAFNSLFAFQCKTLVNNSTLPDFLFSLTRN